jgi:hypothetical protein
MSVTAVKEAFEEIPTRAQSALDTQWAYYKLSLFRFIAKSAIGLITFFIVAFACLLLLIFLSFAFAYAMGNVLGNVAYGFLFVGIFYFLLMLIVVAFRKKLIERPLLSILSDIYFKAETEDDNSEA